MGKVNRVITVTRFMQLLYCNITPGVIFMDPSILISAGALGVAAISFFYNIGRDSKSGPSQDESKIDQLINTTTEMSHKLDKIAEWQREAAGIHASHSEQIKTLFNRIENLENRMEDRQIINDALRKILERVG